MNSTGRWPDFVGIGAIKAGTTWLHTCLAEHPQIFAPATKEIQFFTDRYEMGESWYRELFAEAMPEQTCGEFTPAYMHDADAIGRMHGLPDQVRFLVCLRNPVDRAFSHFMMSLRDSAETNLQQKADWFADVAADPEHPVIRNGFYDRQLAPYFDRFGDDRIHLVLFEDIKERPEEVLRGVYRFLCIDDEFLSPSASRVVNPAVRYRNAHLFRWMRRGVQRAERGVLAPIVLRLKMNGMRDRVLQWWRRPQPSPRMNAATRQQLDRLYRDANRSLAQRTGLDLSRWEPRG